jgi:hypothetical protein
MALLTWSSRFGYRNPGFLLAVGFGGIAVGTWIASYYITPESRWRDRVIGHGDHAGDRRGRDTERD